MPVPEDKAADSAEKAYAAASAVPAPDAPKPVEEKPAAAAPAPAKAVTKGKAAPVVAKAPAPVAPKPAARKAASPKKAPRPVTATKTVAPAPAPQTALPVEAPIAAKAAKTTKAPSRTKSQTKEFFIMVDATEFTAPMTEAMAELQEKAKAAYEKSTALAAEMGDFTKGNLEALAESGKILSSAMQDLGKTSVEEAKKAFETMTADLKEMAAAKSPTDLFQLQSKLMRRNFDAMVAYSSKTSEGMIKLANDAMAPLSSRMSLAADMVSKAA